MTESANLPAFDLVNNLVKSIHAQDQSSGWSVGITSYNVEAARVRTGGFNLTINIHAFELPTTTRTPPTSEPTP